MMRLLITGATGFVGRHLVDHVVDVPGIEMHGCTRRSEPNGKRIRWHQVDWTSLDSVNALVRAARPDSVIHLAGNADAGGSFSNPLAAWAGNLTPTIHLFEAIRLSGLQPRVVHISSGAVYGTCLNQLTPVDESAELLPMSPYAASKAAAEMAAIQYGQHFPIVRVRPFNHIGPGQSNHFALANFAEQIARIENGLVPPVLEAGNLEVERDVCDVRDMVRAYWLLLEKGIPGQAYNAGRGEPVTMRRCVEKLLTLANLDIELQIRKDRQRSIDVRQMRISMQKLSAATAWNPTIALDESLRDVLNDWRDRITTPTS